MAIDEQRQGSHETPGRCAGAGELFDVPRDIRPGGLVWQLKASALAPSAKSRRACTRR